MKPVLRGMFAMVHYFLTPEDSEFVRQNRRTPLLRAAKAVFWLLVSVLAGMALGQLG